MNEWMNELTEKWINVNGYDWISREWIKDWIWMAMNEWISREWIKERKNSECCSHTASRRHSLLSVKSGGSNGGWKGKNDFKRIKYLKRVNERNIEE